MLFPNAFNSNGDLHLVPGAAIACVEIDLIRNQVVS